MRAPTKTPVSPVTAESHFQAVKALCGSTDFGTWSMDDHRVYGRFTGTPEAVAARVMAARTERAAKQA